MKLYKREKKETLRQVEKVLMALLHGHDDTVQLNINDGLLGFDTPYRITLTKQMTLDYYTQIDGVEGGIPHFLVLDVLVNTRYLYPYSKGRGSNAHSTFGNRWGNPTPEDLALQIYHSYKNKNKRSGE